ncbi:MAG: family 43 glycosylhydrolase, partial [Candidatus Eisenbacteria bacterium]|nr:family 43 glycosylhydrolase [Candidatus Eisenbacteria bacterium]
MGSSGSRFRISQYIGRRMHARIRIGGSGRGFRRLLEVSGVLACLVMAAGWSSPAPAQEQTFTNPLVLHAEEVGEVRSCADPTVLRWSPPGDDAWYMVCTSDPLSGADRDEQGSLRYRTLPMFRSEDLVTWDYLGDALEAPPAWAEPGAGLWAPELHESAGTYFLYFAVTDVRPGVSGEVGCATDGAIGVATAPSPSGPWVNHDSPVVRPRRSGPGCDFASTLDPDVVRDETGQGFLLFGGYKGGIASRRLSPDGLFAPAVTEVAVTTGRYEAPEVFRTDRGYVLFASPNGCCNGDLTGYAVMAARSPSPEGPYTDRHGADLLDGRTGGTPVLAASGGAFVGPGHISVFGDRDGTT